MFKKLNFKTNINKILTNQNCLETDAERILSYIFSKASYLSLLLKTNKVLAILF